MREKINGVVYNTKTSSLIHVRDNGNSVDENNLYRETSLHKTKGGAYFFHVFGHGVYEGITPVTQEDVDKWVSARAAPAGEPGGFQGDLPAAAE